MKKETAESLASALKYLGHQSIVRHNLPLGASGYYVQYTSKNRQW